MFFVTAAHADAAQTPTSGGFDIMSFLPIILIFGVFYFLILRPQQLKAKKHQQTLTGLRRGDKVVTSGGIIGTITKIVNDQEIQLEIDEDVKVRLVRSTITEVLSKTAPVDVESPSPKAGKAPRKSLKSN